MSSLLPILLPSSREQATVRLLREAGAVSPATARPLAALPPIDPTALARLVACGTVREGAPGTYYVFARRSRRARVVGSLLFWAVVVLVPWLLLRLGTTR